jgi:D-xylose 1-dehydrogenase
MSKAIYPSLKEKPVLVSGGASGIGEAIVRSFGAQGARVGFVDLLEEAGALLAGELQGLGQKVAFQRCDITDTTQYQRAILQSARAMFSGKRSNDFSYSWNRRMCHLRKVSLF